MIQQMSAVHSSFSSTTVPFKSLGQQALEEGVPSPVQ